MAGEGPRLPAEFPVVGSSCSFKKEVPALTLSERLLFNVDQV